MGITSSFRILLGGVFFVGTIFASDVFYHDRRLGCFKFSADRFIYGLTILGFILFLCNLWTYECFLDDCCRRLLYCAAYRRWAWRKVDMGTFLQMGAPIFGSTGLRSARTTKWLIVVPCVI